MKNKNIVCLDGGGIKGVAALTWLSQLEKNDCLDLKKIFCFSGTSTGSIIVAGLLQGFSVADLLELYKTISQDVFKRSLSTPKWLDVILWSAPYEIEKLREVLRYHLGTQKIGDIKQKFVIPIWDLYGDFRGKKAATTLMANNFGGSTELEKKMLEWPLYQIVAGSSAAPTYFQPNVWKDSKGIYHKWTDGGQCDNSALLSILTVLRDAKKTGGAIPIQNLKILSIGTGHKYCFERPLDNGGWATPRRIRSLVDGIVQSNTLLGITTMRRIIGSNFHRVNFELEKEIDLDNVDNIDYLISWAKNQDLRPTQFWLNDNFKKV